MIMLLDDWLNDYIWKVIAAAALIVLGVFLFLSMFAKKEVVQYYLSHGQANGGACVMASINWAADATAFCSDDIQKTLAVLKELKQINGK